jgi:hypothetical protein
MFSCPHIYHGKKYPTDQYLSSALSRQPDCVKWNYSEQELGLGKAVEAVELKVLAQIQSPMTCGLIDAEMFPEAGNFPHQMNIGNHRQVARGHESMGRDRCCPALHHDKSIEQH